MVAVISKLFDSYKEKFIYNIVLILLFTFLYKICHDMIPNSFNINLNTADIFYFTCVTNFTLGYGDVLPSNAVSKVKVGLVEKSSNRIATVFPDPIMLVLYTLSSSPP